METHYAKYGRAWYEKNKEKNLERSRKWQGNNRRRAVEITQAYVLRNKDKVATYNSTFSQSVNGKYRLLRYRQKRRGWDGRFVTLDEFAELFSLPCHYCGDETKGGLDRVENSVGYSVENVVPCCELCNHMKWTLSAPVFLQHISKINAYER